MPSQNSYGQIANYNVTPRTRADGDPSSLEVDNLGNLFVSLATALTAISNNLETDSILALAGRRSDAFQATINFASSSVQTIKAATTSKAIYLTDLIISTDGGAGCNIIIQDDSVSPVILLNKLYFAASFVTFSHHFNTPLVTTSGQALKALCSSATPNVTVVASGYVI